MNLLVREDQSTFVAFSAGHVGAVEIEAAVQVCSVATELTVTRIKTKTAGVNSVTEVEPVVTTDLATNCQRLVAGLEGGEYSAVLKGPGGALATRRFAVDSGKISKVTIEAAASIVSGRLTLNGRPISEAAIEWTGEEDGKPIKITPVDGLGNYVVTLERPGTYYMRLTNGRFPLLGQERIIEVRRGENTYDWNLVGGVLTVQIAAWDRSAGVTVTLARKGPVPDGQSVRTGIVHTIAANDPTFVNGKIVMTGLGLAEYTVRASQLGRQGSPNRVSPVASVSLTSKDPERTVGLNLAENTSRFTLSDGAGNSVRGAKVYGLGAAGREEAPGVFTLDSVPPGLGLYILARGYTPSCRIAPTSGEHAITMDVGQSVEVHMPGLGSERTGPIGSIIWSGVECPLPLDAFPFVRLPQQPDKISRFLLSHFPLINNITYLSWDGKTQGVTIAGGVVVIPVTMASAAQTLLSTISGSDQSRMAGPGVR